VVVHVGRRRVVIAVVVIMVMMVMIMMMIMPMVMIVLRRTVRGVGMCHGDGPQAGSSQC
jgi:phosphotransferase system  glucose/maltose/N-acetylglucosamine-specific IIC component